MFNWHASLSYSYFIVKCSYSHILKYMVYKNCFHTHMVMCIAIKGINSSCNIFVKCLQLELKVCSSIIS